MILTVALFSAPPPVAVEVVRVPQAELSLIDQRQLQGWVVLRLLEEGYMVVPARDQAGLTLRIVCAANGLDLQVDGDYPSSAHVETGASVLVQLETLHRSVELLAAATTSASAYRREPTSPRITLRHTSSDTSPAIDPIRLEVAVAALEAGASLTPVGAEHDGMVCLRTDHMATHVTSGPPEGPCGTDGISFPLATTHVDTKLLARSTTIWVERARRHLNQPRPSGGPARADVLATGATPSAVAVPLPPPARMPTAATVRLHPAAPNDPRQPLAPRIASAVNELPPVDPDRIRLGVGILVGTAWRTHAFDPALAVEIDLGRPYGASLSGHAELRPSQVSGRDLVVIEHAFTAGAGWKLAMGRVWTLGLSLAAGGQRHHFSPADGNESPRWDWTIGMPIEASRRVSRELDLGLRLRPAVAGRGREHVAGTDGTTVLWSSSPWSLALCVGMRYRWGIR